MGTKPYEIIIGAPEVYIGPKGEAKPHLDDTPAGNWVLLGTEGRKNFAEDGVKVKLSQKIALHRTAGATGPVKASRESEDLVISLKLLDLSLAEVSRALNGNTVSDTAASSGIPGSSSLNLNRGLDVTEYALLVKGDSSPEGDGFTMQYWVPRVIVTSDPEIVHNKKDPAGVEMEFTALEDGDQSAGQEFGTLEVQSANAT
jgi:hypothetical protein